MSNANKYLKNVARAIVESDFISIFAPSNEKHGAIAQLVEQRTENPCVPGSIPGGTTHKRVAYYATLFLFSYYPKISFYFPDNHIVLIQTSYRPVPIRVFTLSKKSICLCINRFRILISSHFIYDDRFVSLNRPL